MKIRFLKSASSPGLFRHKAGDEIDLAKLPPGCLADLLRMKAIRYLDPEPDPVTKPEPVHPWQLMISPEEYLNRYPTGPSSDKARRILGQ